MIDIGNSKLIIIVGLSGVGKSTFTEQLSKKHPEYTITHTDYYLRYGDYGSQDALHRLVLDIRAVTGKHIVEGSLCYRLLRAGYVKPDLVIHVGARASVRQIRRPDKDYSRTDTIYKKIWWDYLQQKPSVKIVEYDTTNLI